MTTQLVVKTSKSGKTQTLYLRAFGKDTKVIGMWESFTGWYWYATEVECGTKGNRIFFGFVQGFEEEWGSFSEAELKSCRDVWSVPKTNWPWSGRGERIQEQL